MLRILPEAPITSVSTKPPSRASSVLVAPPSSRDSDAYESFYYSDFLSSDNRDRHVRDRMDEDIAAQDNFTEEGFLGFELPRSSASVAQ